MKLKVLGLILLIGDIHCIYVHVSPIVRLEPKRIQKTLTHDNKLTDFLGVVTPFIAVQVHWCPKSCYKEGQMRLSPHLTAKCVCQKKHNKLTPVKIHCPKHQVINMKTKECEDMPGGGYPACVIYDSNCPKNFTGTMPHPHPELNSSYLYCPEGGGVIVAYCKSEQHYDSQKKICVNDGKKKTTVSLSMCKEASNITCKKPGIFFLDDYFKERQNSPPPKSCKNCVYLCSYKDIFTFDLTIFCYGNSHKKPFSTSRTTTSATKTKTQKPSTSRDIDQGTTPITPTTSSSTTTKISEGTTSIAPTTSSSTTTKISEGTTSITPTTSLGTTTMPSENSTTTTTQKHKTDLEEVEKKPLTSEDIDQGTTPITPTTSSNTNPEISEGSTPITPTSSSNANTEISEGTTPITPTTSSNTSTEISEGSTPITPTTSSNTTTDISKGPTPATPTILPNTTTEISKGLTPITPTTSSNTTTKISEGTTPITPTTSSSTTTEISEGLTPITPTTSSSTTTNPLENVVTTTTQKHIIGIEAGSKEPSTSSVIDQSTTPITLTTTEPSEGAVTTTTRKHSTETETVKEEPSTSRNIDQGKTPTTASRTTSTEQSQYGVTTTTSSEKTTVETWDDPFESDNCTSFMGLPCPNVGFYRLNQSCTLHYRCVKSKRCNKILATETLVCPKCLKFNAKTMSCEEPENVPECTYRESKHGFYHIKYKKKRECTGEGQFAVPEHCSKYYDCKKTPSGKIRLKVRTCPDKKMFNDHTKKCEDDEDKCPKIVGNCTNKNVALDNYSCEKFYICDRKGKKMKHLEMYCPPTYLFNGNWCQAKNVTCLNHCFI